MILGDLTLTRYIVQDPNLSDAARAELLAVIPSRGKNKGRIRASLPAQGKTGRIGYNAVMLAVCPVRAAVWSLMFEIRRDGTRALFDELTAYCDKQVNETALLVLGSRPFEYSLWDHHNDRDRGVALVTAYVLDGYKRGANMSALTAAWKREREQPATDEQRSLFDG